MSKYETKTKPTKVSVDEFLSNVEPEQKRADSYALIKLMQKVTGEEPHMWGPTIIGFGTYHYKYESGHEGDAPIAGFSPRAQALTLYLMPYFVEQAEPLLNKLGKFKASKGCLYVKKLADVDMAVLEELVRDSVAAVRKTYP